MWKTKKEAIPIIIPNLLGAGSAIGTQAGHIEGHFLNLPLRHP